MNEIEFMKNMEKLDQIITSLEDNEKLSLDHATLLNSKIADIQYMLAQDISENVFFKGECDE
jgi:ribosome assembly protein YihI (activator of Der GTPase)